MKKTASKGGEAVKTKQPPRTSPSAKSSLNHLRPPTQMKIPSRVDLRQSTVDESILGVWSKRPFKKGEVFGPFMGKKVMDATEDMDPSYVWEIVDKETKEFLFYIDATDLRNANWMRYINCARHFDEQNIISEQIDVDIFYKVIKDIPPGEELLTWYKKPKLRKKPIKKRQLSCASNSGSGEKIPRKAERSPVKADRTPGKADRTPVKADRTLGKANRTPVKADRTPRKVDKTPGKNDKPSSRTDKTPRNIVKSPVKAAKHSSLYKDDAKEKCVTSSKVKVKAELKREAETPERDVIVVKTPPKKALKLTRTRVPASRRRKSRGGRDGLRRVPASVAVTPEDGQAESLVNGCFQFVMKDYHVVKGRSGRRLYRCDICGSVYRHAFSLKRHYIRSHINYLFVSKMDRLNCNVSAPEDAVTFGDMVNFDDDFDGDGDGDIGVGDGDVGEDDMSVGSRLHGSDVDKADAGGKCEQEGLEEPVCKKRKASSDADEVDNCDSMKSDGVDADKVTNALGEGEGDSASPSGKGAVDGKLDTENSVSDEKESVAVDESNKSVVAAEENSSSTVVDTSGVSGLHDSAVDDVADVCSATDVNKGSTVKAALCSNNGASDGPNNVDDKSVKELENGTRNEQKSVDADRDSKSVDAPGEKSADTMDGASGSPNSALHDDADVCKGSPDKNASRENKPSILDQPSNKTTPGTVGDDSASTNHSAPDEAGTDSVTHVCDKELNSIDKDNVKNSATDEKISTGPTETKQGENDAECKHTEGKMNGVQPTEDSAKNATPVKDQGPENGPLPEDHSEANGLTDTESCSATDGKKSADADSDDKVVGASDESIPSTMDAAPGIGNTQSSNVKNVELDGSSDVTSKTAKCSTNTTDSAADSATKHKNNDSKTDDHDNTHNASDDNCDISAELQDKQGDDMSDVTKHSDDGSGGLTVDGVALVYRCHICHSHLGTKLELKQHLVEHSQDGMDEKIEDAKSFACDQCEMTFLSVQNLARHQTVHSGEKPFVCRYCNKKFPTVTNQRRHERIHQGRRFCCGHCQRSFTQTGDLKKHISKLHPELFHECVLCGKYFGSDDLLEEHLGSHGDGVRQNWKAMSLQRGTHRANLELDRAESMKLATVKSGAKFACTICRKLFDDYANMCRHRRLAHQRSSILNVRMGRSATRCCVTMETPGGNGDPINSVDAEESEDAFYARIAENISDNLTNFLEGKKVHLDNCYVHINEKLHPSSEPVVSSRRRRSSTDNITRINVAQYNFPKTFRLRSSRAIENCGRQDGVNEKDNADDGDATEQKPSEEASPPDGSKSVDHDTVVTDTELMHVPKVRQCVQCRRNFHTFQGYREHMYVRHKTLVPDDANKSEDWRNEQPSSPPDHDRIAAPLLSHKLLNDSADVPPTTTTSTTPTNKSKLSYSGWKNGLLTGVRKDECSVGDAAGDPDSHEVLDVCDLLLPDDEPSKDADIDKPFNYKLNLVARCYICNVCNEQFSCFESLIDHQYDLHPNVNCTHLEVAVDGRPASWLQTAPVGLLRVTTNHVPAVEDFKRNAKAKFRCTKCNEPFASMLELHTHITECASEGVPVIIEPPRVVKTSTKYKVKTVKGRKKTRPASPSLPLSPGYDTFRGDDLDASHDVVQDRQRKKRRKNFELLYNPLHHVRRRELTQVLEIHNCGGCHQQFETISMLERHVRICKQKDKLKQLRAISASLDASGSVDDDEDDEYAYDPSKHMCIYCLRQFTYLGMLRKHVTEWCQVRQEFIDHGDMLDNEWEDILEVKGKKKEGKLSRQSSFSSLNGVADSQDAEDKKVMKPKWGTKWKCRSKQVDEPTVRLESESSTDSFIEPRQSEESRTDEVESSQESHECKKLEVPSDSTAKDNDDKNEKPFSCLLKPNGSVVDAPVASAEKDVSES